MISELTDLELLDESRCVSLTDLQELSGLSETEIRELTEIGVLVPARQADDEGPCYAAHFIVVARTASRLRDDFELDTGGLALGLTLLQQMRKMEARIRELEALLPH